MKRPRPSCLLCLNGRGKERGVQYAFNMYAKSVHPVQRVLGESIENSLSGVYLCLSPICSNASRAKMLCGSARVWAISK